MTAAMKAWSDWCGTVEDGAVVVTGNGQDTAMSRRTGGVGVLEHIARAVDARPLAVPDADDAILAEAR